MPREQSHPNQDEYQLIELLNPKIHWMHPFDATNELNASFYFIKKSYLETLGKLLEDREDIISWGLRFGPTLSEMYPYKYSKQKPALLLSRRRSNIIPVYVAFSLFELAYLIRTTESGENLSTDNRESFIKATENPFDSRPDPEVPEFRQVFLKADPTHCLCWIPVSWDPDFTGENHRQGRILIDHLMDAGLVTGQVIEKKIRGGIRWEFQDLAATPLAHMLLEAWHSWVAALARSAWISLPSGLLEQIPLSQRVITSRAMLTYLTEQGPYKITIRSLRTQAVVSYTPLRVAPIEVGASPSKTAQIHTTIRSQELIEWWEAQDAQGIIMGHPGHGKTSFLRYLFNKKLKAYLAGEEDRLCVFVDLNTFTSYANRREWFLREVFHDPQLITPMIDEFFRAGKLLVFCDNWDQVAPGQREGVARFLWEVMQDNNRLTLVTRFASTEQLPQYLDNPTGQPTLLPLPVGALVPLNAPDAATFLRARNPQYSEAQVQRVIRLFEKNPIELIPLWLDLLPELTILPEEGLTEAWILDCWVTQKADRDPALSKNLEKVEKLAFMHLTPLQTRPITRDYAMEVGLTGHPFHLLKREGWLVPTGREEGKDAVTFCHPRLEEYLAARYVWQNWARLTGDLFHREEGMLSQRTRESIVELALFEGIRREARPEILVTRVCDVAGTPGWTENGIHYHAHKLRDPFLAGYLLTALRLPSSSWVPALDQFLRAFWTIYEDNYLGWHPHFDEKQVFRAVLARIPEDILLSEPVEGSNRRFLQSSDYVLFKLWELRLADPVLDQILTVLDQHTPSIWENPQDTVKFFRVLLEHSSRKKWQAKAQKFLKTHITQPNLAFSTALRCVDDSVLIQLVNQWSLSNNPQIRKNCAQSVSAIITPEFIQTHSEFILGLAERWLQDDGDVTQIAAGDLLNDLLFVQPDLLTAPLARQWLQSPVEAGREHTIQLLLMHSRKNSLFFNPVELFAELDLDFPTQMQVTWLDICDQLDVSTPETDLTLKWFFQRIPLSEVIRALRDHPKFPQILKKIAQFRPGPVDEIEARASLDQLPFHTPEVVPFAKQVLYTAKDAVDLFLAKVKVYSDLARGVSPAPPELQELLEKDPATLTELLDALQLRPNFTIERIISGVRVLSRMETRPSDLLRWVARNPLGLTLDLLDEILQSGDKTLQSLLVASLLWNRENLIQTKKLQELIPHLLMHSPGIMIPQLELISALLIEDLPLPEKWEMLPLIATHPSAPIRAIGLRVEAEAAGVQITRVVSKAATCVRRDPDQMAGRPIVTSHDPLSRTGIIGLMRLINHSLHLSSGFNFGLLRSEWGIIPKRDFERESPEKRIWTITRDDYAFLLDWKDFAKGPTSETQYLRDWKLPARTPLTPATVFGEALEHQWALRGLRERSVRNLRTTLFYLEDIMYQQKWAGFSSELRTKLEELEHHRDPIVKTIAAFLRLSLASESEIPQLIKAYKPAREYLQAILWAWGPCPTNSVDRALVKYLRRFPPEKLLVNLIRMIPWIFVFPRAYKEVWTQLVCVTKELATAYLFRPSYFLKTLPLDVSELSPGRSTRRNTTHIPVERIEEYNEAPTEGFYAFYRTLCLTNQVNSFFPTKKEVHHYSLHDDLFRELSPRISWSRKELDALTAQLTTHSYEWLRLLGQHLRVELGLGELDTARLEHTSLSQATRLLYITHIEKLPPDAQQMLLQKVLATGFHEQMGLIKRLQRLPVTSDILPLLRDVLQWFTVKHGDWWWMVGASNEPSKLKAAILEWWEQISELLLTEHFQATVNALGDLLTKVPLYGHLQRGCLQDMHEYLSVQNTMEADKVSHNIFRLLHPKIWYANSLYWQEEFFVERTEEF